MNWSHSSKIGLVLLSLLVLVAAVGVASAVSVTQDDAPDEAEVGEEVTVTVELQDLFADVSSWELSGQTELDTAEWTIELYQGDELQNTHESSGQQPDSVLLEEGVTDADRAVVTITGTSPEVSSYSYEEPPTFLVEVVQVVDGGSNVNELSQHDIHHYTTGDPGSQEARTSLDDADTAIQSAADDGEDVSDAESTFDEAASAYDDAEFSNAVSLAGEAQSQAESSGSSDDGSDSDDGTGSDDSSSDGTTDDSTNGSDGGITNERDADGNTSQNDIDGGNATDDGSSDSDDGGLLWPILYGLFGLLILGGILGGVYWYLQQSQGPNRDPLG